MEAIARSREERMNDGESCQKQRNIKNKLRRGLWSPEEDEKLMNHVRNYGPCSWTSVPAVAGLQRCGKSCRLRWINYLRPDLKRGTFSDSDENRIVELHSVLGNRWSRIASYFPGRTDNDIKNLWNSKLRKRILTSASGSRSRHSKCTHNDDVTTPKEESQFADVVAPTAHPLQKANSDHSRIPTANPICMARQLLLLQERSSINHPAVRPTYNYAASCCCNVPHHDQSLAASAPLVTTSAPLLITNSNRQIISTSAAAADDRIPADQEIELQHGTNNYYCYDYNYAHDYQSQLLQPPRPLSQYSSIHGNWDSCVQEKGLDTSNYGSRPQISGEINKLVIISGDNQMMSSLRPPLVSGSQQGDGEEDGGARGLGIMWPNYDDERLFNYRMISMLDLEREEDEMAIYY